MGQDRGGWRKIDLKSRILLQKGGGEQEHWEGDKECGFSSKSQTAAE